MKSHLFAHLFRLRQINRWSLIRGKEQENVAEHTLNVCFIVHALCSIANVIFRKNIDIEKVIILALGHDTTQLFTGDIPIPLQYHHEDILTQMRHVEELAANRLMGMVPVELKAVYENMFSTRDSELHQWIKAADLCDAYLKCKYELTAGNKEFATAEAQIQLAISQLNMPEVEYFLNVFAPSFDQTLKDISNNSERLTKEMIPAIANGLYEINVENETNITLHGLCEDGKVILYKDELTSDILNGVQRFLNERGIRHLIIPQSDEIQIYLIE
ncbi:5'-deoxynucleotidase [Paenibacillus agricola]|uniref:5'-deoxynucleotidase n=1 Tax=Paenibacillus agricola TaxID=2716264 RepID=A0ABX0JBD9_9BACL|nr:5'-deoxynucleotidase [Paenibacillus agricola]NHN33263.1 5'-deoxynucleotidase [Paenibacillus agricola]